MPTAAVTWGSRIEVGTRPVCPPPSLPCATTAPAPSAATFSACRLAPTDGMTTRPASVSSRMTASFGASPNEATRTPCLTSSRARMSRSGASPRRFTPNGAAVSSLVLAIAASVSATVRVAAASTPSPPALHVAAVSSGVDTQPMPVCTIGYLMPSRSQAAVCSAGWSGAVVAHGTSLSRSPRGSMTSRMRRSSSGVGSLVCGTSPSIARSKPVLAMTSATLTPGCTETSRMAWPGERKSSTARFVTTRRSS